MASDPNGYDNGEVLLISFLLCLFITGVFAFTGFAYPSSRILPDSYYKIKHPAGLKYVGQVLRIKYFRYLLLLAFYGRKSNRKKYFNGTKEGLGNFVYQTRQSEFGHLGAFVVIMIASFILLLKGYILLLIITTFINIVGNLYPIILQRLHRERIERLTNRNNISDISA